MRTAVLVYIIAAILAIPTCAKAFTDYDVDWPTSISGKEHTLRIVIDGCTTLFKVADKNLEKFRNDEKAKQEVVMKAIQRTNNNCKD
jgi:hypothetical protein